MKDFIKILLVIAWFVFLVVGAGRAMFTGQSFAARPCEQLTWQSGDKTKGYGQDVVSPCSAGVN